MDENLRFIQVLDELKNRGLVSDYVQISASIGTNKAGISDIKGKRKKVSVELLRNLRKSYPDVNIEWIITGEGEMFKTNQTSATLLSDTPLPRPLSAYKDNTNQAIPQEIPPLMDRLLSIISEKDAVIRSQAEEIGRLREQIDQLKQVRGHDVPDAISSDAAIAG